MEFKLESVIHSTTRAGTEKVDRALALVELTFSWAGTEKYKSIGKYTRKFQAVINRVKIGVKNRVM